MTEKAARASKHLEAGRDDEAQAPVSLAQGMLDRLRRFAARENEPGVAGALGEGLELFVRLGRHHDVFDAGNAEGGVQARHLLEESSAGNGQHHGAGGGLFARQRG